MAKITRIHIIVTLLALTGAPQCQADFEQLVTRLRAEAMSLFDWGIYRLERDLQRARRDERDFLRVFHAPSAHKLIVEASFVVLPDEIAEITEKTACFKRLHAIKLLFGVIDTSEVHLAPASDYVLGLKFSHQGPDEESGPLEPDAIGRELMQAIEIRVGISSDKMEFPFSPDMRCSGDLLSQVVRYNGVDDIR